MTPHYGVTFAGRLTSELEATGVPIHLLGGVRTSRPWTVWHARRALARLLKEQRFDVVVCHSPWIQAIFGPVARRAGQRLVFWLHDAPSGKHWLERWAGRTRPDKVVCNSTFSAGHLTNLYKQVPARVLHYPVGVSQTSFSAADRRKVRAESETPDDAVVLIQVSRLEPWKGHRLHLEALGRLVDLPGWMCWQVGGPQRSHEERYFQELKSMAGRRGIADRVRFLGQRADVPRLLAAADIHCQPNTGPEPFGITFIEGLLAGLPVVTTAMGGALEILDASCGILVNPGDAAALAKSLRQLIVDPTLRVRLGAAGPGQARRLCDPGQQLTKFHDFFREAGEHTLAA
jgi:glycosyltransferase involved in cell wall biosynthesis